jgi:hypothetical protein
MADCSLKQHLEGMIGVDEHTLDATTIVRAIE